MERTAIITGGTRGIGKAIALRLAKENFNLVINYANDDVRAKETLSECTTYTPNAIVFKADIAKASEVKAMVDRTIQLFSSIEVLVNNAGINIDKPLFELSEEDWDKVVDVNMKGIFLLSKEVAGYMMQQDGVGRIINLSATTAIRGRKNGINYCASKAGVIAMTKCLALELSPKILVNCVIPGFTWTEETVERFNLPANLEYELHKRNIPLGRMATPEEIANIIYFLVSNEANYITGQKIIIDGGEFMV